MEEIELSNAAVRNVLEYSQETFVRAFADYRDGIKPIHRRILWTMFKGKMVQNTKVSKIVGATLEYHPHGDSSVYGALVRMTQPWVMNYPYIEGQGNYGTQDGDPAAAGRYIEARMSQFSKDVIFDELDNVTVDFEDNYDYKSQVPVYLPTKIPLLLVNGIDGIGEAFRTYVPPHNLADIADRCIMYIRNKKISNEELVKDLYPDFPTGGEILNGEEVQNMYKTGSTCVLKVRGKAIVHPDTSVIELTEFPYGVPIENIENKIIEERKNGNMVLNGIVSMLDDNGHSDEDDVDLTASKKKKKKRIFEYTCRKEANLIEILNEIYRTTQFKTSITLSYMTTQNGYPKYVTVKGIIEDWYKIRYNSKKRRHGERIASASARCHVLEGLLSVYDRLDEVIKYIRSQREFGKDSLIKGMHDKFNLTVIQAEGIYNMNLGSLSDHGQKNIEAEVERLKLAIEADEYVLDHTDSVIIEELKALKKKYGRPRKTTVHQNYELKVSSSKPVVSSGAFLYSANMVGLYDSNGCKDSKTILTGMKPWKGGVKSIREIIGGEPLRGSPIGFAVCYNDATIQKVDASVFRVLNVWYDTKCDEKDVTRAITSACPFYSEEQELLCLTQDMKMKRIKVSELNKRAVSSGSVISQITSYDLDDPDLLDYILCGTSIDKEGKPVPTYSLAPVEEIPLIGRSGQGVKTGYEGTSSKVCLSLVDLGSEDTSRIMIGCISTEGQNSMYSIPVNALKMTGRVNKPKSLGLPKGLTVTSCDRGLVESKEQSVCMIGKTSSSTLSAQNFKKPFMMKNIFITVNATTIL